MIKHIFLSISFVFIIFNAWAQQISIMQQGKPTSIRGLSVVNNKIAWVSGSKGYFALTKDGGKNWLWQQIKGFERADFRDIEAFSAKKAIIMSSGTPALILKTVDGGASWQIKYRNPDTAYFLDAMDFEGKKHGFVLGDPINNKFILLETIDGGETWLPFANRPEAVPGEAAFAASGTCLRITTDKILIATGGQSAAIASYSPKSNWTHHYLPLLHGKAPQGAFSIAIIGKRLVIVGGDYQNDKRSDSTACYSINNGLTWEVPLTSPYGYQSCIEYIAADTYLSTGTPGTNITTDGGRNWKKIDAASFNVCRKAKHGSLVLLAGNSGKIGILLP